MYRRRDKNQLSIYDFILPFGGHLNKDNRWVRLREMIDWTAIEEEYIQKFENVDSGQEAFSSDLAFGFLYIQRKRRLTDRELVEQIAENPYMQYFIGFKEFQNDKPFDPSLLVHFRKRFPEDVMNRITEKMFVSKAEDQDQNPPGGSNTSDESPSDSTGEAGKPSNRGTLIIDASCAPADIAYPTDLELCDRARRWVEIILDHYWRLYGSVNGKKQKPRTYREIARKRFLKLNKRRRKTAKKIRKELRYQLGCIRRNLDYIEAYVRLHGTDGLLRVERERLSTIRDFYSQQKEMLEKNAFGSGPHRKPVSTLDPTHRTRQIQSADRIWGKDIHKRREWLYLY